MKNSEGNPDELKEKFWKALASSPYLFLQLDGDSATAVPMSPQLDEDANHAIWFFTQKKSKFAALGAVTATFESKGHDLFARFDGNLSVETSRERFEQFWNNFVAAWYDGGKDDPDILFPRQRGNLGWRCRTAQYRQDGTRNDNSRRRRETPCEGNGALIKMRHAYGKGPLPARSGPCLF